MSTKAYEVKGKVVEISATSRVALKIRDNYYTVEYTEKRSIPDVEGVNMDLEHSALWDTTNAVVDNQASEIMKTFK